MAWISILSPENQKKVRIFAMKMNVSEPDLMNLILDSLEDVDIAEMQVERTQTGKTAKRQLSVRRVSTWKVRL